MAALRTYSVSTHPPTIATAAAAASIVFAMVSRNGTRSVQLHHCRCIPDTNCRKRQLLRFTPSG
jgi:hypothetical protein